MKHLSFSLITLAFAINAAVPTIVTINNSFNGRTQSKVSYLCQHGACKIILDKKDPKKSFKKLPQDKKLAYLMSLSLEERERLKSAFSEQERKKYFPES